MTACRSPHDKDALTVEESGLRRPSAWWPLLTTDRGEEIVPPASRLAAHRDDPDIFLAPAGRVGPSRPCGRHIALRYRHVAPMTALPPSRLYAEALSAGLALDGKGRCRRACRGSMSGCRHNCASPAARAPATLCNISQGGAKISRGRAQHRG